MNGVVGGPGWMPSPLRETTAETQARVLARDAEERAGLGPQVLRWVVTGTRPPVVTFLYEDFSTRSFDGRRV